MLLGCVVLCGLVHFQINYGVLINCSCFISYCRYRHHWLPLHVLKKMTLLVLFRRTPPSRWMTMMMMTNSRRSHVAARVLLQVPDGGAMPSVCGLDFCRWSLEVHFSWQWFAFLFCLYSLKNDRLIMCVNRCDMSTLIYHTHPASVRFCALRVPMTGLSDKKNKYVPFPAKRRDGYDFRCGGVWAFTGVTWHMHNDCRLLRTCIQACVLKFQWCTTFAKAKYDHFVRQSLCCVSPYVAYH